MEKTGDFFSSFALHWVRSGWVVSASVSPVCLGLDWCLPRQPSGSRPAFPRNITLATAETLTSACFLARPGCTLLSMPCNPASNICTHASRAWPHPITQPLASAPMSCPRPCTPGSRVEPGALAALRSLSLNSQRAASTAGVKVALSLRCSRLSAWM